MSTTHPAVKGDAAVMSPARDMFSILPAEIRAQIYNHILPQQPIINFSRCFERNRITAPIMQHVGQPRIIFGVKIRHNIKDTINLMYVSSLFRREILPRFYRQRHWVFSSREDLKWFSLRVLPEVRQLISSIECSAGYGNYQSDPQPKLIVDFVLDTFPNLTQLCLIQCGLQSNRFSGPAQLLSNNSLVAFEAILKRRPDLENAYYTKNRHYHSGNPVATVRFVNEDKPLHPVQAGKLNNFKWPKYSDKIVELQFDVRQERQYFDDAFKELEEERRLERDEKQKQ
jgi:hypothetical protein